MLCNFCRWEVMSEACSVFGVWNEELRVDDRRRSVFAKGTSER